MGTSNILDRGNGHRSKARQVMREVALVAIPVMLLFRGTALHVVREIQQDVAWHRLMATRKAYDNSLDMRASRSRHPTAIRVKR